MRSLCARHRPAQPRASRPKSAIPELRHRVARIPLAHDAPDPQGRIAHRWAGHGHTGGGPLQRGRRLLPAETQQRGACPSSCSQTRDAPLPCDRLRARPGMDPECCARRRTCTRPMSPRDPPGRAARAAPGAHRANAQPHDGPMAPCHPQRRCRRSRPGSVTGARPRMEYRRGDRRPTPWKWKWIWKWKRLSGRSHERRPDPPGNARTGREIGACPGSLRGAMLWPGR
jgi:hypothetical protein